MEPTLLYHILDLETHLIQLARVITPILIMLGPLLVIFQIVVKIRKRNDEKVKISKSEEIDSSEEMDEYYRKQYEEHKVKIEKVVATYVNGDKTARYNKGSVVINEGQNNETDIDIDYIALKDERLAWFETNFTDLHILHINDGNQTLAWEPISHNLSFGCDVYLLKWLDDQLLFIYKEKHDIYICTFDKLKLKEVHFHGEEVLYTDEKVYIQDYHLEGNYVRVVSLPNLNKLSDVSKSQLDQEGIKLHSVYDDYYFHISNK